MNGEGAYDARVVYVYMHGGACTKTANPPVLPQPFFAFEALIVIYSLKWGRLPPALSGTFSCPLTGENTLLSSLRAFVPASKKQF